MASLRARACLIGLLVGCFLARAVTPAQAVSIKRPPEKQSEKHKVRDTIFGAGKNAKQRIGTSASALATSMKTLFSKKKVTQKELEQALQSATPEEEKQIRKGVLQVAENTGNAAFIGKVKGILSTTTLALLPHAIQTAAAETGLELTGNTALDRILDGMLLASPFVVLACVMILRFAPDVDHWWKQRQARKLRDL